MFCGLQGVSRSFEARKRDAVTVSLRVSRTQNIFKEGCDFESMLSETCYVIELVEEDRGSRYCALWSVLSAERRRKGDLQFE